MHHVYETPYMKPMIKTNNMETSAIMKPMVLVLFVLLLHMQVKGQETMDPVAGNITTYQGRVVDAENGRSLPFATIEAVGSNVATVSNIDGEFTIKISEGSQVKELKISYIGYKNSTEELSRFRDSRTINISLQPSAVHLQEITIRPVDATSLIAEVLDNVKTNYSNEQMMMRGFYRETIQRGRNYASISEAVVDIYKGSYVNNFQIDRVKLFKGRKSADVEKMDTVLFKLQGGPNTAILLDVVKNPYVLLTNNYAGIYDFTITDVIALDDQLHYVVSFKQKPHVDEPFYAGKLYIHMDHLAITEAEFELNTENAEEAARLFIQRKPMGMTITPERAAYRSKYTIEDNRWYFSYARAEVKFKVNWKKKLFNTTYNTMSELAITDRTHEGIEKFTARERFRAGDVMNEKVYTFFDQDFWEGYNVIEPDQSIQSAVRKLNRIYLRRNS